MASTASASAASSVYTITDSSVAEMSHSAEVMVLRWTLKNVGLLFADSERVVLKSKDFGLDTQDETLKFRLEAAAKRLCPQSQLRIYARLVNLNERRIRGKYVLGSHFRENQMQKDFALAETEPDAFLKSDLHDLEPDGGDDEEIDFDSATFIGWAGQATDYLSKIVHVRMRLFRFEGDSFRLERPPAVLEPGMVVASQLGLPPKMVEFVSLLYLKLKENILLQLNASRTAKVSTAATQTEAETDWESVSSAVIWRLIEVIQRLRQENKSLTFQSPADFSVASGMNDATTEITI